MEEKRETTAAEEPKLQDKGDRLSSEVQHLKIERQHGQTCVKCNHHKNTYKE